jgi:predicted GNAT family N-acyltransferase
MTITVKLGDWNTQKPNAYAIRKAVFVIEQSVPDEMEWDEFDLHSVHAVAFNEKGVAIGTGRLLPDGRIGRMSVLASARGLGVGGLLLEALMQASRQRGDQRNMLSAQVQAEGFYGRYGFVRCGAEFVEAGIAHIEMDYLVK